MAGTRVNNTPESSAPPAIEPMSDITEFDEMDIDEVEASGEDESSSNSNLANSKSTDVRRRIEERLEVRMLRDELGIDDFDL